jgi:putative transposase
MPNRNLRLGASAVLGVSPMSDWHGETPSWAIGANLLSNGDSLNQESPSLNDRRKEGV